MAHTTVYQGADDQYRWRVQADNHEIIADSAEGYTSRASALHGLTVTAAALAQLLPQLQTLVAAGSPASVLEADAVETASTFEIQERS